jgi:hypothetical protein
MLGTPKPYDPADFEFDYQEEGTRPLDVCWHEQARVFHTLSGFRAACATGTCSARGEGGTENEALASLARSGRARWEPVRGTDGLGSTYRRLS